ncbi:MAG: GyrI-like domain-containing protein [bacterium]|nr:GyrI-like domain-containing protein [bacterium]
MIPTIISENSIFVVGMSFYGDPFNTFSGWSEENEIGLLWKRFMQFFASNPGAIKHIKDDKVFLELHIETSETAEKGIYEVFIGTIVEKIEDIPLPCSVKQLPATEYAIFTLKGKEIFSDWEQNILGKWLNSSQYESAHKFGMQYYDNRFKGMDNLEESELDVYVPVKKPGK